MLCINKKIKNITKTIQTMKLILDLINVNFCKYLYL